MMVRPIIKSEIKGLNSIVPKDWNFNYESFLTSFFEDDFFKAFVITKNNEIVAAGNVLMKNGVGWLGNIMVDPKHRKKGYGMLITQHLISYLKSNACKTQLLVATKMGEPMYLKLGFKKTSEYIAFKTMDTIAYSPSNAMRNLQQTDLENVSQLDQQANGEDRSHLINKFYQKGVGCFTDKNELLGFYLPSFARGAIVSKDKKAGLALLLLKHQTIGHVSLIPVENQDAITFLKEAGVAQGESFSRMLLGIDNHWKPKMVYSYASGYCG